MKVKEYTIEDGKQKITEKEYILENGIMCYNLPKFCLTIR